MLLTKAIGFEQVNSIKTLHQVGQLTTNSKVPAAGCGTIQQNQSDTRTGIIYYSGYPQATPVSDSHIFSLDCTDEPYESLVPIVLWAVGQHPANDPSVDTYEAGLSPAPNSTFTEPHGNVSRWDLTDTPLW